MVAPSVWLRVKMSVARRPAIYVSVAKYPGRARSACFTRCQSGYRQSFRSGSLRSGGLMAAKPCHLKPARGQPVELGQYLCAETSTAESESSDCGRAGSAERFPDNVFWIRRCPNEI